MLAFGQESGAYSDRSLPVYGRERFPRSLLESRWHAAWEAMRDAGLDALLVAGRGTILGYGNLFYLGGYLPFLSHGYVLLRPGYPADLIFNARDQAAAATFGVGDLVCASDAAMSYGFDSRGGLGGSIVDVLRHRGLAEARVGTAGMRTLMPAGEFRALTQQLPSLHLVEADDLLASLKALKSDAELELGRQAASIADDCFELFPELVRAGADELDVIAAVEAEARRHGVVHSIVHVLSESMDLRQPVSRQIRNDEVVACYAEIVAPNGFWVEKGGSFAVGDPPASWLQMWTVADAAVAAAETALTAGAPASAVARAVREVADAAGCQIGMEIGHGVGVDHDPPLIDEATDAELLAGMTVVIHPLLRSGDRGALAMDQYTVAAGPPVRHSRVARQVFHV